jgi:ABC-type molybdate transport system substrate-binding protein
MSGVKFFIQFLASMLLAVLAFSFAACNYSANQTNSNAATSSRKNEITVSAAASLQGAFREIGAEFEKQTGAQVNFNLASSGVCGYGRRCTASANSCARFDRNFSRRDLFDE